MCNKKHNTCEMEAIKYSPTPHFSCGLQEEGKSQVKMVGAEPRSCVTFLAIPPTCTQVSNVSAFPCRESHPLSPLLVLCITLFGIVSYISSMSFLRWDSQNIILYSQMWLYCNFIEGNYESNSFIFFLS